MKNKKYIILLIVCVLLASAFYNGLLTRKYTIKTDKADEGAQASIVVLTDLHNTFYGDNQEKLIAKIKKQKPDLILLIGDMIDNALATIGTEKLLEGIKGIAPIYYVTGNHEFWTGKSDEVISLIESCGVNVLRNETRDVVINGIPITLCGTDDPDVIHYSTEDKYKNMQDSNELLKVFDEINEDSFNILMAHRPERIEEYKKYDFDLVLSGHAHGGQVRIPLLLNGLFAPDQGWFPKYAGGRYKHDGLTHIVSRGLSISPRLPRIFNPPEVVVVKIIAE